MEKISFYKHNMDISKNVLEMKAEGPFWETAQKVAVCTIFPFILISSFEAIVKNLLFYNVMNLLVAGYNFIYDYFRH